VLEMLVKVLVEMEFDSKTSSVTTKVKDLDAH